MVQHDPPWNQLRRGPGVTPGMRDRDPQTYSALPDAPDLGVALDLPQLNRLKYAYWFAEFGIATNPDFGVLNTGAGSGFTTLSAENGAGSLANGGSANSYAAVMIGRGADPPDGIINPNKHPYFETRATLATNLGTAKRAVIGFCNGWSTTTVTDLIGFRATGTGRWFAVCRTGGAETTIDTGIAAALATVYIFRVWVDTKGLRCWFEMLNDANPRVRVFGPVPIIANIPTTAQTFGLGTHNSSDVNNGTIQIDYIEAWQLRQAAA